MGLYRAIWTPFDPIFMIFYVTPSMIFPIFDARMASTGPGTRLERCGSKFCVGWWSRCFHSSHMEPICEKPVPRMDLRCHGPGTRTTDHGPGFKKSPWRRLRRRPQGASRPGEGDFLNQFLKIQPRWTWGGGFLKQVHKNLGL